jgi:hypothetical protein
MPKQFQILSNRREYRGKHRCPYHTYVHDRPLPWRNTDTSIKSGWGKLVVWAQTSLLSHMGECVVIVMLW